MIKTLVAMSFCFTAFAVWAVPPDVAEIFNRNNRQLQAPPSSLRSNDTNTETRYFSGMESVQRAVNGTPSTANDELEVMDPIHSQEPTVSAPRESSRVVVVREARQAKRQDSLRSYAFNGKRVVGVGFVGAGSYGIFGAEFDFSFGNDWSGGFGIGTGMAYSTWGLHARKYFHTGNLTPYFQMGYASWLLARQLPPETDIFPLYLGEQFLQNKDGSYRVGKRLHLVYPALGVLYQSESGLAFTLQLQYLISALDFKGALAGAFGMHFLFLVCFRA
jgi:hypothetical protein